MARLLPEKPTALVTLLPTARALSAFPNLSWDDVLQTLRLFEAAVTSAVPDLDMSYGYRLLATELAERIESHPNRDKGWV